LKSAVEKSSAHSSALSTQIEVKKVVEESEEITSDEISVKLLFTGIIYFYL
jgi:hypothetical protein